MRRAREQRLPTTRHAIAQTMTPGPTRCSSASRLEPHAHGRTRTDVDTPHQLPPLTRHVLASLALPACRLASLAASPAALASLVPRLLLAPAPCFVRALHFARFARQLPCSVRSPCLLLTPHRSACSARAASPPRQLLSLRSPPRLRAAAARFARRFACGCSLRSPSHLLVLLRHARFACSSISGRASGADAFRSPHTPSRADWVSFA